MRLETCIRKGLRLKAHRVSRIQEEEGLLVAYLERVDGKLLTCSHCSRRTRRVHSRRRQRRWRDLRVRDQDLVLVYSPVRVKCLACGPRMELLPWARRWQRITRLL